MIKKIQITNFRSCKKVELDKLGDVVALIGRNGAGKTNVLRAVDWFARMAIWNDSGRSQHEYLPFWPNEEDSAEIRLEFVLDSSHYIHHYKKTPRIISRTDERPLSIDTLSENLTIKKGDTVIKIIERVGQNITSPLREGAIKIGSYSGCLIGLDSILPSADPLAMAIRPLLKFLSSIRYYPIDELSTAVEDSGLAFIIIEKEYQKWLSHFLETGIPSDSVMMRILHMFLHRQEQFGILKHLLGANALGLIDNIDISTTSIPVLVPPEGNNQSNSSRFYQILFRPSLALRGGDSQPYFVYKDLSTGTRRVIKILVSLLFDESSVMLLEHPEDGIHSGLLSKLIAVLKTYAGSTQIIFASHSSTVLNELEPKDIRMVAMKAGNTTVHALKPKELKAAKQYLAEQGTLAEFLELVEDE